MALRNTNDQSRMAPRRMTESYVSPTERPTEHIRPLCAAPSMQGRMRDPSRMAAPALCKSGPSPTPPLLSPWFPGPLRARLFQLLGRLEAPEAPTPPILRTCTPPMLHRTPCDRRSWILSADARGWRSVSQFALSLALSLALPPALPPCRLLAEDARALSLPPPLPLGCFRVSNKLGGSCSAS
jgi:hypothetical protein